MSPSEIAFLALGIVLGAAIGAAIVEAVRSRPAPRREVRVTIAPNSVLPRRSATLAAAVAGASARRMPGSPEDEAWREGPAASFLAAATLGRRSSGHGRSSIEHACYPSRPSCPRPRSAVPVDRAGQRTATPGDPTTPSPRPRPHGRQAAGGVAAPLTTAPAVGTRHRARPVASGAGAAPRPARPRPPRPVRRPPPSRGPARPWPDQGAPRRRAARSARSRCSRRWPRRTTRSPAAGGGRRRWASTRARRVAGRRRRHRRAGPAATVKPSAPTERRRS